MLNMVLKDMSNKTGYKVVPTSQIKYNRRRRKRREGKKTYTGTCTQTHTHALAWRRQQSHGVVSSNRTNDR